MPSLSRPRSTLARAVLPVVGGVFFFALLGVVTWGIAAVMSDDPSHVSERLARTTFEIGSTEYLAGLIADDGPLLFQGLVGADAEGSIVVDHTGDNPARGWRVYYAHPADRAASCIVTQVEASRQFVDCEGRTIEVEQLAPPPDGVRPIVGDTVIIDLRGDTATTATDVSVTST